MEEQEKTAPDKAPVDAQAAATAQAAARQREKAARRKVLDAHYPK